ncbi:MAG TPA: HDIG domain-containing protein [Tepidisphaeraceae bacterium]|nr:HDIG domain-containing protein [Tepidisphaeraceae bacterium]
MFRWRKYRARRAEIRRNRPDASQLWQAVQDPAVQVSFAILIAFWAIAATITLLREQMVRYRPDQYVHEDIASRVSFSYTNPERVAEIRQAAREAAPRVYRQKRDAFDQLERRLLALPEDAARGVSPRLAKDLEYLDSAAITLLIQIHRDNLEDYKKWVRNYASQLREACHQRQLVILPHEEREADLQTLARLAAKIQSPSDTELQRTDLSRTFSDKPTELLRHDLLSVVSVFAEKSFLSPLATNIAGFTVNTLQPTHELDPELTAAEQNAAAKHVSVEPATRHYPEKAILASKGTIITQGIWKLLVEEQRTYINQLGWAERFQGHAGMAGFVALIALGLATYVAIYQPRIIHNHARAMGIAALLVSMQLVAMLAGIGTGPLLIFGIAPTILVAMILAIAYDQRFALGVATLHGVLVTAALGQGIGFFLILWTGAATCCFFLDEVRTRGKLIEVGGAAAMMMIAAAATWGASLNEPTAVVGRNCLYVGAAGLGVGFVVLGILPFIERMFRITTSMTLLELADVSQPLLRRLAIETPGTYNHSLQVATLAEAAAEAINANRLLCRVGSYYHDIGKVNKADYFCENQSDGRNRHLNLSPSVSLLIIIGHVKDGVEMAKEYNLPTVLIPFMQEHHGTTLVEYFYHQACTQRNATTGTEPAISETQYRYPGPKPRTRETAIVMIADAVESACRAMVDPAASRIETLVHDLIMKRLLDGQFDESDVTFQELQLIEKAAVKTLLGIYHGRLAYPSTAATTHGTRSEAVKLA